MRWFWLGGDLVLLCMGVWLLLTAYRVIGKPRGADEAYDSALVRRGVDYKTAGWCILIMAILGLLYPLLTAL